MNAANDNLAIGRDEEIQHRVALLRARAATVCTPDEEAQLISDLEKLVGDLNVRAAQDDKCVAELRRQVLASGLPPLRRVIKDTHGRPVIF